MNPIVLTIQYFSKYQRTKKLELLKYEIESGKTILDVGVWCKMPEPNPSENWLKKSYPEEKNILALGLDEMTAFHLKYPHATCVQANGCQLPFSNDSIDVIFSNAVWEHIPQSDQASYISEMGRIAGEKAVFTVPVRLSPIEIHSKIFCIDWFPFWRRVFMKMGDQCWSDPRNLSKIFSKRSLQQLIPRSDPNHNWCVKRLNFLFIAISMIATL